MESRLMIGQLAQQMLLAGMTPGEGARELKKEMIEISLQQHRGNMCRTAQALGMHRNTLSRAVEELGIAGLPKEIRLGLRRLPQQRSFEYRAPDAKRSRNRDRATSIIPRERQAERKESRVA
jgi:hypothetical protein